MLEQQPFRMLLSVVPFNDSICRLTMPVVKGRYVRDTSHL